MNKKYKVYILIILMFAVISGCGQAHTIEKVSGVSIIKISHNDGVYSNPRWSPNGKQIAYWLEGDLWVSDVDSSKKVKLVNTSGVDVTQTIWDKPEEINYFDSPSEDFLSSFNIKSVGIKDAYQEVVILKNMPPINGFSRNPLNPSELIVGLEGSEKTDQPYTPILYLYDVKSGSKNLILKGGRNPKWSPNGKSISYLGEDGIYVYNVETKQRKLIYQSKGIFTENFSWSPDSKWIAFRGGPSKEKNGIYILPHDGSAPPKQILNYDVSDLDWSPNGEEILFHNYWFAKS